MSTNEVIREYITEKLITERNGYKLLDTDSLIDSGIIDSFGIMSLMGFLEERFSIKMNGEDLMPENFDSIAALSAMVEKMAVHQMEG